MLEFVVVYDVTTAPAFAVADFGILAVAAAAGVAFLVGRIGGGRLTGPLGNPFAVGGVCVCAVLVAGTLSYTRYSEAAWLHHRLRTGAYSRVEGRVENFVPGDRGGHRDERWSVQSGGRTYSYQYSSARRIPGFHQTAGPIREGAHVRIADVSGYIARLEIDR